MKVPGTGTPRTYALTEADENEVKQVAVALFDGSGNYVHYSIYNNSIACDPDDNANTSLSEALISINSGNPKPAILKKLLLAHNAKWGTDTSSGSYKPIPMCGEITDITVSSGMPKNTPVTLSYMVSKIEWAWLQRRQKTTSI